jgi:hypothetical protein
VNDKNGDQPADSHNILNRWKNYFSQLLKVQNVTEVRQLEIHAAEPLVSVPSPPEVETAIAKLKKYKLPAVDPTLVTVITARGEKLLSASPKKLILFGIRRNCPISGWLLIIVPIHKNCAKTDCNNYPGI